MHIGDVREFPATVILQDIDEAYDIDYNCVFDTYSTQYCVATHSFGVLVSVEGVHFIYNISIKVLNAGTPDVLIIDDLEEITPDIITVCSIIQFILIVYNLKLLYKIKQALRIPINQRILRKVFLFSSSGLLSDIQRSIIRYFSDDSITIGNYSHSIYPM